MESVQQISELLDLNALQRIQDDFAKSMNLGFVTVDYKGRPLTKPSGFTEFCTKAREKVAFREMCYQCDAHGGLHAAITGVPYVYRCHADLVDFAVPLILEGSYVGSVLGGQVKLQDKEVEQLEYLIPRQLDWQKDPELVEARKKIPVTEYSKVESSVTLLRNMIQYILDEAFKKAKAQEEGNEEKKEKKSGIGGRMVDTEGLLYVLNTAAMMAYHEKAPNTEEILYNFSDMIRYCCRQPGRLTTVGDEVGYITKFLQVQKAQYSEQLTFDIQVPESCWEVPCPYMLLQPLVQNALQTARTDPARLSQIRIRGQLREEDLLLYVEDNGTGMKAQEVESVLDNQGYRDDKDQPIDLYNMNRKLKGYYGPQYGLTIRSVDDGIQGTEICIRLPLGGVEVRADWEH